MSNKEEKKGDEVSARELRELCCEHLCYDPIEEYEDETCVLECVEEWDDPCGSWDERRQEEIEEEIMCDEEGICL